MIYQAFLLPPVILFSFQSFPSRFPFSFRLLPSLPLFVGKWYIVISNLQHSIQYNKSYSGSSWATARKGKAYSFNVDFKQYDLEVQTWGRNGQEFDLHLIWLNKDVHFEFDLSSYSGSLSLSGMCGNNYIPFADKEGQ